MNRREFLTIGAAAGAVVLARRGIAKPEKGEGAMDVVHFPNSYMTFTTPGRGNNARILIESRCQITDLATNTSTEYYVIASCKGEHTYAERDLFVEPNYDFSGIFSQDEFVLIRVGMNTGLEVDTRDAVSARFDAVELHIERDAEPKLLESKSDIVQSTLNHIPLVGRVQFDDPSGTYRTMLEFPIKTINVNDIQNIFQVDTGPVAWPDWELETERIIDKLKYAYVAYNTWDFADFVVQEVTPAVPLEEGQTLEEVPKYRHYSRIVRDVASTNQVIAVAGHAAGV